MAEIEYGKIVYIDLNSIELDRDNPRIPLSIKKECISKSTEEVNDIILEEMIKIGNITDLMLSIGENGFFDSEPILLIPDEYNQEKFIVVEGNRRITALKLLHKPESATKSITTIQEASDLRKVNLSDLEKIPSIVYRTRDDVLAKLGYRHIKGIKNWNALEKARYMKQFYLSIQKKYEDKQEPILDKEINQKIAKSIGSHKSYVKRILEAFKIYLFIEEKDFFDIANLDDKKFHFVNLSDSLYKPNLKKFLIDNNEGDEFNKENLKIWTKWLFEEYGEGQTRLNGTSSNLTKLDKVVSNSAALERFIKKEISIYEAAELAKDPKDVLMNSLSKALKYLTEGERILTKIEDIEEINTFDEDIRDIRKKAKQIYDYKEDQLKSSDEF